MANRIDATALPTRSARGSRTAGGGPLIRNGSAPGPARGRSIGELGQTGRPVCEIFSFAADSLVRAVHSEPSYTPYLLRTKPSNYKSKMSLLFGKSIKMHLVDGTPQGIMTAEIMNWTGHVLIGLRAQLPELVQRSEMNRTGIYFLTGPDPDTAGKTLVYIGESDNVGKRLIQHNKDQSKDFWERACVVTSKDQNLTKAHARYLESRLIALSQGFGHASVHNATSPEYGFLPEADIADMEYFISMVRLILPVLGHEFLREKPHPRIMAVPPTQNEAAIVEPSSASAPTASPIFVARSFKHGLIAQAQEIGPDFIVLAGSETQPKWIGLDSHSYKTQFDRLIAEGKLLIQPVQNKAVFQEDVAFRSPSAASAIVFGRASNGRVEWKVRDSNQTYADWQNEKLSKIQQTSLI
jgi:hypothetical protein